MIIFKTNDNVIIESALWSTLKSFHNEDQGIN